MTQPRVSFGEVLRDVAVHGETRALVRPAFAGASGLDEARKHIQATAVVVTDGHVGGEQGSGDVRRQAWKEGQQEGYRRGFEEGERHGHQQGLEQGLIEGRQAGTEEVRQRARAAQEALAACIERLDQLLCTLPTELNEQVAAHIVAAEDDMVALCHTVICRLLGDKALKRDSIVHSVREAVDLCCGTSGAHAPLSSLLAIHVHPRDLQALQADATMSAWFERQGMNAVPWLADEAVRLGGCIVRSTQGSLDARLETQFAALQEMLLLGRAEQESGGSQTVGNRGSE
jgi:flagellar assembly protein FliH